MKEKIACLLFLASILAYAVFHIGRWYEYHQYRQAVQNCLVEARTGGYEVFPNDICLEYFYHLKNVL